MALNDSAVCDCLINYVFIELKKRKLLLIQKKVLPLPPLTSNGLSCGVMVTQQILVLSFWVRVPAAQRKEATCKVKLPFFVANGLRLRFEKSKFLLTFGVAWALYGRDANN